MNSPSFRPSDHSPARTSGTESQASGSNSRSERSATRTLGLWGATGIGIGAIVGGGILVLAGVAFKYTGPGALVAFLLNGLLAFMTALSFAEVSTRFPESGGVYTFAKKLLSVRAAFGVGWILWFAYIVAGVLYALGFASYAVELCRVLFGPHPWLESRTTVVLFALAPTAYYASSLIREAAGGGQWATWGKVVVFAIVATIGLVQLALRDWSIAAEQLTPYFPRGAAGLLQAMGLTFIALQGFDLISAVAGEVKDPERTIPRAMLLSLGVALLIYLPLLLVVSTVGTPTTSTVTAMSESAPETVMARAAELFMGPTGYWLIMVAALLSTLSALQANLLAASRVAQTMGEDRTLPAVLSRSHAQHRTPHMAIYASALTLVALLFSVPDLAAAGSAASLVFLIAFAIAHYTAILARRRRDEPASVVQSSQPDNGRSVPASAPFEAPFFPLIPVVGGLACVLMAAFQAIAEPAAGGIAIVWLGLGGLLYVALFSNRAESYDAFAEAQDPVLARMRGRNPLVLVPVANPRSVAGMVEVAAALAPPRVGRVMLLRVIRALDDSEQTVAALEDAQRVMAQALRVTMLSGHRPEGLVTIAQRPWQEIGRVVRSHSCSGLVLGLPERGEPLSGSELEELINSLGCDVTLVRCAETWRPSRVERIVVPVGRRGHELEMRARVLGSLHTHARPEITWVTVVPSAATKEQENQANRRLLGLAQDNVYGDPLLRVERSDDPVAAITALCEEHDLLVLGLHRDEEGKRLFGSFNSQLLAHTEVATLLIGAG